MEGSSATMPINKRSQETNAEVSNEKSEAANNFPLDPLVYFSRILGIPEMILNHLKAKDLMKFSEVSPIWYNVIASSTVKPRQVEVTKGMKSTQSDFKWFLFNVTNDFSDIYIKSWSRYLSYKVIMEAVERAKLQDRAVALIPSSQNTTEVKKWPGIFALASAPLKFKEFETMTSNFLIFGPYTRNSNSNLLLMQNGKLMLKDDFEKRNNIKRQKRTRCMWIYANTLKCIQDADLDFFLL